MVESTAQQLANYLKTRVGDGLRTVIIVSEDDYEIQYLRRDLKEQYSKRAFDEVVDDVRVESLPLAQLVESHPIGEQRAVVHYYDSAFVVQFPYSDTEQILISVATDAGASLLQFIEGCRQIVDTAA
ncbi:hypothetical protein ACFQJC_15605 [Haloferax namakaokahaiae]|uniref:Uncharacterized protein n=1 Tax=Haloferax namakaokahaiae TaxID=1748331 RepID=A0ABD5ZI51_9EURY